MYISIPFTHIITRELLAAIPLPHSKHYLSSDRYILLSYYLIITINIDYCHHYHCYH